MVMTVTTVAVATATGISEAKAVNAAGQVVGSQDTTQAFLWTPNTPNGTSGTTATLPSLFIGGSAIAFALDNNGNVVGSSTDPTKTLTRRPSGRRVAGSRSILGPWPWLEDCQSATVWPTA